MTSKKTYHYSDMLDYITSTWDIKENEAERMLAINGFRKTSELHMAETLFKKSMKGVIIAHLRHSDTRYEIALKGGIRNKKYEKLKKKYTRIAEELIEKITHEEG